MTDEKSFLIYSYSTVDKYTLSRRATLIGFLRCLGIKSAHRLIFPNAIDRVSIASTGSAIDFSDLTVARGKFDK